jgi:hypothetical protein
MELGGSLLLGVSPSFSPSQSPSVLIIYLLTADVGGFFGNPELEMLARWYVVGVFSPFFCTHAHINTKHREPYLLEEPYKSLVRDVVRLRYSMLRMRADFQSFGAFVLPPLGDTIDVCVNA